jgi:hypothetical protein
MNGRSAVHYDTLHVDTPAVVDPKKEPLFIRVVEQKILNISRRSVRSCVLQFLSVRLERCTETELLSCVQCHSRGDFQCFRQGKLPFAELGQVASVPIM